MKPDIFSKKYLKKDFFSGLIVFLIALPLCLGIAQACHAPLFAGVVAGIVGGIVIGSLSGSHLSVSGPAAGLTAIVLVAITKMPSFEVFLCSVIIAGVLQVLLGYLRAGAIANYIPSSVLEGMLAGIGLTIIIKQLPDAVGFARNKAAVMTDADDGFIMSTITSATQHMQVGAIIIAATGIVILALWQLKSFRRLAIIPAGVLVVLIATMFNELFKAASPQLALDSAHLVSLPVADSAASFFRQFSLPDLKGFTQPLVWETGIVIAVVASIETLLCVEATDKLDPQKRYTPTERELKAQGVGNIVSGFLGGLPITSVIVRSSANVNAGAMTKRSAIIHGALLLLCAASIPALLNLIPKAGLAAILIFTGFRLCRPAIFKHMWHGGFTQFIPFVATLTGVVALDLLKGVGIGIVLAIIFILRENIRIPYYFQRSTFTDKDLIKLTLAQEVSFLNKASIKQTLERLPDGSTVVIDASQTHYIDFDVLDLIREFAEVRAKDKGIHMSLTGFKEVYNVPETLPEDAVTSPFVDRKDMLNRTAGNYKILLNELQKSTLLNNTKPTTI